MKIDPTMLLLIAAGGVGIYFLTRPPKPVVPIMPVYNPALYGNNFTNTMLSNPTSQDITAGGQAVSSVINALSNGGVI
jgi:hypothetical protein